MWKEFKAFVMRGNVLDLAIAVIIGGAFGAIVTSLVNDILMPIVGVLIGGLDFSGLSVKVGEAVIGYGKFIQATVNFLIIALALFLVVRIANKLKKEEAAPPPPKPSPEETLLAEIRDILKSRSI